GTRGRAGTMGYKYRWLAQDHGETLTAMKELNVNLKWIPDVDRRPNIAQLIGYHLQDITLQGAWAGSARLHLVPHVQCRVAGLPVGEVMFGRHLIADLTTASVARLSGVKGRMT